MEPLIILLWLAAGLVAGGLLVGVGMRGILREKSLSCSRLERDLESTLGSERQARDLLASVREERARLESQLDSERKQAAEKLRLLEEAEVKLREAFQALSAEALKSNNQAFLELARTSLEKFQKEAEADLEARQKAVDDLVAPVHESLKQVDVQLRQVERDRLQAYTSLREQIRSMAATQQQLHAETTNLVKALKSPTVRGRWGEIQLRRVVEMAGMLGRCDFFEQETTFEGDRALRPDLRVQLPGDKSIIVDAKVPLEAYLAAVEAAGEPDRRARMEDHARHVRDHMIQLGGKGYWKQFDAAPEFVVMFMPGENIFSAALQHDPSLLEFGVDKKVIPASPITLIALLRAVAYGWQQEKITREAEEIGRLGTELHERIRILAEHFASLRTHLDRTVDAYNKVVRSLESRVLVTARRFRELGVAPAGEIAPAEAVEVSPRSFQAEELAPLGETVEAAEAGDDDDPSS
jgi:DNA recombination protein RmuC